MSRKISRKNFKKLIRQAHLYLGLFSGLVILIVSLTGCLWVFQEEITSLTNDLPVIQKQESAIIPPSEARSLAENIFPGRHVHGTLYDEETSPIKVIFYELEPEFYHTVYLQPYTGEVMKVENNLTGFFPIVLEGHRYLWLPKPIGEQLVAWSTVIFAFMLISGIILWWPKNKKSRRQRFTLDWKNTTKWKRKNYDLHSVAGFYICFLAVIIVFTGLVMAFDWFGQNVYQSIGGNKEYLWRVPDNESGIYKERGDIASIDKLFLQLQQDYPEAVNLEFHYPYTDSESIYVEIGYEEGVYYNADYRFYDQNTLEELSAPTIYGIYEEAGLSEKVMRMNYDIHVGAIGGLPGKVLAFFASLICASLPVTGFTIWYGRKFKKKTKPAIQAVRKQKLTTV